MINHTKGGNVERNQAFTKHIDEQGQEIFCNGEHHFLFSPGKKPENEGYLSCLGSCSGHTDECPGYVTIIYETSESPHEISFISGLIDPKGEYE
jgi:hypothetical protein